MEKILIRAVMIGALALALGGCDYRNAPDPYSYRLMPTYPSYGGYLAYPVNRGYPGYSLYYAPPKWPAYYGGTTRDLRQRAAPRREPRRP